MRNEKTKAAGSGPGTKGSLNLPDHESSVTDADSGLTPADVCQNGAKPAQADRPESALHPPDRQGDLTPHQPTCRDCAKSWPTGQGQGVFCNSLSSPRYNLPTLRPICQFFEAKPEQGEGSPDKCSVCEHFRWDDGGETGRCFVPDIYTNSRAIEPSSWCPQFRYKPTKGEGSGVGACEGCAYLSDPRPDRCMLCRRGPHGHPFQLDGYDFKDGPAGCTELDDSPKALELIIDWASRHWFGSQTDAARFARDLRAWLEPRACPFCGANDAHPEETTDDSGTTYMVCESCGAQGPPFDSEWTALLAWNKRGTR